MVVVIDSANIPTPKTSEDSNNGSVNGVEEKAKRKESQKLEDGEVTDGTEDGEVSSGDEKKKSKYVRRKNMVCSPKPAFWCHWLHKCKSYIFP